MIIIIDSGSTQTRLYLVRDEKIVAEHLLAIGVNSGKDRSQGYYRDAIAIGISELLRANQLTLGEVRFAIASGMITSNLGLLEIPHITAPVSLEQLVSGVVKVKDHSVLPLDLEIRLVPGIKNAHAERSWSSLRDIDLMRGEETQAVGLMTSNYTKLPLTMIELGSTTKLIHIDAKGNIAGSITSLSGQVYAAVKKETFIGASMLEEEDDDFFSADILHYASDSVHHAGLLRTLLFTRFVEFSLPCTAVERTFFCQAALASDDMKLFEEAERLGFSLQGDIVLIGNRKRCQMYCSLWRSQYGLENPIHIICDKNEITQLAIKGAVYIAGQMK
ncbi:2-dehydro-3-deoxygalactonokinase [Enterobacter hormaechei]|uniref:2-dehydro-3-deoxygalactonokinase n=1 Tax=Enterobacter hormaechei TaxID=158836 RepID=UPI0007514B46|nr:2-dehydro-3-deoxygalactonokinase [Enterobacter hormaechei]KUR02958.1 hypothetical protein AWI31_08260 [Enterobacter hormaechei subsp. xiangfangensis]